MEIARHRAASSNSTKAREKSKFGQLSGEQKETAIANRPSLLAKRLGHVGEGGSPHAHETKVPNTHCCVPIKGL